MSLGAADYPEFYRIEKTDMGESILKYPTIPRNPFKTILLREDATIPRIAVAPSLLHCLAATLGSGYWNGVLYKLADENVEVVKPFKPVPDAHLTKEHWILQPAKFKRVGYFVVRGKLLTRPRDFHSWLNQVKKILSAKVREIAPNVWVVEEPTQQ